MKVSGNKLTRILTFMFIMSCVYAAWIVYKLPDKLVYQASVIDMQQMDAVNPILNELNLFIGLALILGIMTVIAYINTQKVGISTATSQSTGSGMQEEVEKKDENEEEIEEIFKDYDLDHINLILAEKEDNKLKLNNVLNKICNHIEAVQGALYVASKEGNIKYIELVAAYAYHRPESEVIKYEFGEGLAGQVAKEGKLVNIKEIPAGYIKVISGLGDTSPNNLVIIPLKKGNNVIGVVEIASFKPFKKADISYLEQVFSLAAEKTMVSPSGKKASSSDTPKKSTVDATIDKGSESTIDKTSKSTKSSSTTTKKETSTEKTNAKTQVASKTSSVNKAKEKPEAENESDAKK